MSICKVICIDATDASPCLIEGNIYTADYGQTCNVCGHCILICELDEKFRKDRFIPVSEIDEVIFERSYKFEKV